MKNTKKSITFKVVVGYLLVAALAVAAVWVVYGQIVNIARANRLGDENNRKLLLVSEAVTNLYVAEGISRNIIQNEDPGLLPKFHAEIDSIVSTIDSLKQFYPEGKIKTELDSITELLSLKEENLKELLAIRQQASTQTYYARLRERLRSDEREGKRRFRERLENLGPEVRELLKRIENYKQFKQLQDNPAEPTEQFPEKTADSLMNSIRTIMGEIETEERQYQSTVSEKENELLENDRRLSSQLREIRSAIERGEIQKSFEQVAATQKSLEKTTKFIAIIGGASILAILLFVVLIIRDTTKSQQYREELEESKNFAERLLKGREQLMATVTHDLRSPLNSISGYSDLLGKTPLSDKQEHYLEHLKKSSSYSLRLVNDLLDLSKLEVGKMKVEKLPFNPKDLIGESLARAIPAEDPKNLEIVEKLTENMDTQVIGDPFRIQQILANLISNAYKFTKAGSIKITGELIQGDKDNAKLKIGVRDTGIGISKDRQKAVFEEFAQAEDSIENEYGGFGLGLAISKKMIELLGGKIELESEPGKGSVFNIFIPIKADGLQTSRFKEASKKIVRFKNPGRFKILIIDDEDSQLALTREIIKQSGLGFEGMKNPTIAFKKLKTCSSGRREEKFDLVLTDIQMPKMNGFQLIRNLKKSPKTATIPVIALSGRTDVNEKLYLEKGFKGSLTKPFSAYELLWLIGKTLNIEMETLDSKTQERKLPKGNYDLADIKAFAQNDRESIREILASFVASNEKNLMDLEESHKKNDLKKLADTAHKMLPMFRQLKIDSLIPELEALEKTDKTKLGKTHLELLVKSTLAGTRAVLKELKAEI